MGIQERPGNKSTVVAIETSRFPKAKKKETKENQCAANYIL